MNSFSIARRIVAGINDLTINPLLNLGTFTAETRVRSFNKTQQINGLTVHVIPVPPETEVTGRGGDVALTHQVIVAVFDRRPPGQNDPTDEFQWHEARSLFTEMIVKDIDWHDLLSEYGTSLSEAEIGGAIFDGVDTDTVFSSAILLTFETSE